MTLHLSREDTVRWDAGGWLSLEVQGTVVEDLERLGIREAVSVMLATGQVAFAVTPAGEVIVW